MRERRIRKLMAPASKHRAPSGPEHARASYASRHHLHSDRGAGCRNFSRLPARGRAFSLDILFYRTERLQVRILFEPAGKRKVRLSWSKSRENHERAEQAQSLLHKEQS